MSQFLSDVRTLELRVLELEAEHRELDHLIEQLQQQGVRDELQIRRLKKRKLQLKDQVTLLQMQLSPDVPA
ncbi:MAG: YdcH family protein [Burkholderiaceae bacterium]